MATKQQTAAGRKKVVEVHDATSGWTFNRFFYSRCSMYSSQDFHPPSSARHAAVTVSLRLHRARGLSENLPHEGTTKVEEKLQYFL
jgi:hypothetical protein